MSKNEKSEDLEKAIELYDLARTSYANAERRFDDVDTKAIEFATTMPYNLRPSAWLSRSFCEANEFVIKDTDHAN